MTLIVTHLSRHGIILASDSNLTYSGGKFAREAQKTFEIPHLRAGLSVSGRYSVNDIEMDKWMSNHIAESAKKSCCSLSLFAESLRAALESEMRPEEKTVGGSIIHIAGYVGASNSFHPEFYLVSNYEGLSLSSGEYLGPGLKLGATEDFWRRDCPHRESPTGFVDDREYTVYANGAPSARIGYMTAINQLRELFDQLWGEPRLGFRPPQSLDEAGSFVELNMSIIHTRFKASRNKHGVGGPIQTHRIAPPSG